MHHHPPRRNIITDVSCETVPYETMNNREATEFVLSGGRLPRPERCPTAMYSIMLDCWNMDPNKRPTFHYIYEELLNKYPRLIETAHRAVEAPPPLPSSVIASSIIRSHLIRHIGDLLQSSEDDGSCNELEMDNYDSDIGEMGRLSGNGYAITPRTSSYLKHADDYDEQISLSVIGHTRLRSSSETDVDVQDGDQHHRTGSIEF